MNLSYRLIYVRVFTFLLSTLAICFVATVVWAQATSNSTVSGQVVDQSNAAVTGAEVTLIDPTTNTRRTTTTNEVGRYIIVDVSPGTYEITVAHPGFSSERLSKQQVEVGQALALNFTLQVGSTSTVVEVKATGLAELQTLNATIGSTIHNDQLQLLPNLGRDASALSVLQVGVSLAGNA